MKRVLLSSAVALGALVMLSGCETTSSGPVPAAGPAFGPTAKFRIEDFAWSEGAGRNSVVGRLVYKQGQTRYTCAGSSVILTPETPWTRERMMVLYKSDEHAAAPSDEVRARTPSAPPGGDYAAYIRRTACDPTDHFSFAGVPNGAWYAITTARAVGQADGGPTIAVMRRVVAAGGKVVNADL